MLCLLLLLWVIPHRFFIHDQVLTSILRMRDNVHLHIYTQWGEYVIQEIPKMIASVLKIHYKNEFVLFSEATFQKVSMRMSDNADYECSIEPCDNEDEVFNWKVHTNIVRLVSPLNCIMQMLVCIELYIFIMIITTNEWSFLFINFREFFK